MTLPKKFLHCNISSLGINKSGFIIGICVAILFSLSFYSLFIITREILRVFSTTENNDVWLLSEAENNFYNLFYAFISVIFGQSICFSFWLSKKRRILGRRRYLRSSIMTDQSVLNSYFVLWFTKMAFMFACFFGLDGFGGFYVFSFYPGYNYLFILIIVVLFFQSWVTIRRIFKNQSLKWMLVSILAVSGLSFSLSKINIVDYQVINKSLLANNIYEKYHLDIPESEVWVNKFENKSLVSSLYFVKSQEDSTPLLIVENRKINYEDLETIITRWRESMCEIDIPRMIFLLHIDNNISMEDVNKLRLKLSSLCATRIAYTVVPANRKYDKRYYRNYGFQVRVPMFSTFPNLPPPPQKQEYPPDYKYIIKIKIPESGVYFINEIFIDKENLAIVLKELIREKNDYIVQISTNSKVKFSSYFIALQCYRKAIEELRNEYANNTFFLNFDDLDEETKRQVEYRYPFSLYEDIFYEKGIN